LCIGGNCTACYLYGDLDWHIGFDCAGVVHDFPWFQKRTVLLTLNDNQKIKIKMSKISKKKKQEKQDFVESMNFKISNAVNTGAVFERAGTALTVGDLRNHVSAEERKSEVEAIKNNHN